jgi:hypothetical protein
MIASGYNGQLWVLGGIKRGKYDAYMDLRRTIYNRMYNEMDNYLAVTVAHYDQMVADIDRGYGELPPEKFRFDKHQKLLDLLNSKRNLIPRFDAGVANKNYLSLNFLKNLSNVWDKIAKRFNEDKSVVAIQPWNEPGIRENKFRTPEGFARFREYLQEKFKDIKNLNKAFGADYKNWNDIVPPKEHEIELLNKSGGKHISLNSADGYQWKLHLDPNDLGEKQNWPVYPQNNDWQEIRVPELWEKTGVPGTASYNGLAWYKLDFETPKDLNKKVRVHLFLTAVDDNCKVFLNGKMLAENNGFATPIEVDITEHLKENDNSLFVRVEDTGGGGGIYKDVFLKVSEEKNSKEFAYKNDPKRALWNEWLNFQAEWMGRILKTIYTAVKRNTAKPFVDRSLGYAMTMGGKAVCCANRPEIMSKYCDIYGPHTKGEFGLDYTRGHNQAPKHWITEWYWSGYGYKTEKGEAPMNFMKYAAAFILHPQSAERWAASRAQLSFWEAVSRGASGLQMWNSDPSCGATLDYTGCGPLWFSLLWSSDNRPRMPLFVMLEMAKRYQEIQGNVLRKGSKSRSKVAIIEPLDTMQQISYNRTNADESLALHDLTVSSGYMTDIIPQTASCKDYSVLILPYSPFLAKERQRRLLDFVKNGGVLLLEGPCGLYDQYGNSCAELLEQGFGTTEMLEICAKDPQLSNGAKLPAKSQTYFSLANIKKGDVKGRYKSGEPYFIVSNVGKGKIIFLGMALGKMAGITGFSNVDDAMMMDKNKTGNLKEISFSDKTKQLAVNVFSEFLNEIPFVETVKSDNKMVRTYWRKKGDDLILFAYNRDLSNSQKANIKLPELKGITDLLLKVQFESDKISLDLPPGAGRVYIIKKLAPYIKKDK